MVAPRVRSNWELLHIASLLAEVLAGLGHKVCATAISEDGIVTAAVQSDPDLMIVDVRLMPGSGVFAVKTILQTSCVPHFFITAGPVQAVNSSAAVLQKPFREVDIVHAIELTIR